MIARLLIGAGGVLLAGWGAWLLLDASDRGDLVEVAIWLAAGVVLHDAVLVPAAMLLGLVAARWLPEAVRAPVAVGVVVLGTVTLSAVPVLGRFGALPDNPTLLDRDYTTGWLVLAGLVLLGVVVATGVRLRRGARRSNARSG